MVVGVSGVVSGGDGESAVFGIGQSGTAKVEGEGKGTASTSL